MERYSTFKEVKRYVESRRDLGSYGGPLVYFDEETTTPYHLWDESNVMYVGTTGSGKTRSGTLNAIFSWIRNLETFVAVDPKGDLTDYTYSYAKEAGYDIKVINFREISKSIGVNPLSEPFELYRSGNENDKEEAYLRIDELGRSIYTLSGKEDPFWINSARSLFLAAVYILFEHGEIEEINFSSIYRIISEGSSFLIGGTLFKDLLELYPNAPYSSLLMNVTTAPSDTRTSILSSCYEPLSIFVKSPGLTKLLASDEFKISSLNCRKPTAIYIIMPDENDVYSNITGILVSQIMNHYIRLAHKSYGGHLPRRVNLLLEELGNIGKAIPNLPHLMSAGRSRNLRLFLVLQSLSQLEDIYGKSYATTITSNADTLIAYRIGHYETLEAISRRCGDRTIDYGTRVSTERLISPSSLGALDSGQALVLIAGKLKFVTRLPAFSEINDLTKWAPPDIKTKKRRRIPQTFALRRFIEQEKKRHLRNALDIGDVGFAIASELIHEGDPEIQACFSKYKDTKKLFICKVKDYDKIADHKTFIRFCESRRELPITVPEGRPFYVCFTNERDQKRFAAFVLGKGAMAVTDTVDRDA